MHMPNASGKIRKKIEGGAGYLRKLSQTAARKFSSRARHLLVRGSNICGAN
jgi:hypothetical protein